MTLRGCLMTSILSMAAAISAATPVAAAAAPQPAVAAVLGLFDRHQVVALTELHGMEQEWQFIQQLITAPEFAAKVNDISFECGNSLYQDVMDRYIGGGRVTLAQLQQTWRTNTVQTLGCESPVYLKFLETVRALNQKLPKKRQLRVLMLDPPTDWSQVHSRSDLKNREESMHKVLETEVYAKNHKALFIAGVAHIERSSKASPDSAKPSTAPAPADSTQKLGPDGKVLPPVGTDKPVSLPFGNPPGGAAAGAAPPPPPPAQKAMLPGSVVDHLEADHPGSTYVVGTFIGTAEDSTKFNELASQQRAPWFLDLEGSWVADLVGINPNLFMRPGGKPFHPPGRKFGETWDGLLYVAPRAAMTLADGHDAVCKNPKLLAEFKERGQRMQIPEGAPFSIDAQCKQPAQKQFFED